MTDTRSIRRSALALALATLTGVAFAQTGTTPSSGATTGASPTSPAPSTPSATGAGTTGGGMTSPSSAAKMPARTESADNAFRQLDASNRGYLQQSDVQGLGISFEQADTNKDGRLSKEEFAKAWAAK